MTEAVSEAPLTTDLMETSPQPVARVTGSLFRVIWRWHFYAGLIVGPIVFVVAITGTLYVFKDEIEAMAQPRLVPVAASSQQVSYSEQAAAAQANVSETRPNLTPFRFLAFSRDDHASVMMFRGQGDSFVNVFVDPHNAHVLGVADSQEGLPLFFLTVLAIHRRLLAGTTGRVIVELSTGWMLILLATGVYLWLPRRWNQTAGVWTLRWRAKTYTVLRDLHSVIGLYLVPLVALIAITGLWYTVFMGHNGRQIVENWELGKPLFTTHIKTGKDTAPPSSKSPSETNVTTPLSLDRLISIGREQFPGKTINLSLKADAPLIEVSAINSPGSSGPTFFTTLQVDRQTGEIMSRKRFGEQSTIQWWATWNYPLHVGSILGLPTKIVWFVGALGLSSLPVTGLWMWWQRRPSGETGFPRRHDIWLPYWLKVLILGTCGLLPIAGASILLIGLADWLYSRTRKVSRP